MPTDNNNQTFYEILGVQPTATLEEIKIAYRQRAMEYHPDVNPGANNKSCHEKMCKINEAYRILRDIEARKVYDEILRERNQYRGDSVQTNHDEQRSENSQNKSDNNDHKGVSYPHDFEQYNYYNSVDFDEYTQKDFIHWMEDFAESYIRLVIDYYKKLNINDFEIIEILYKEFNITLENEKKYYKKKVKRNNL